MVTLLAKMGPKGQVLFPKAFRDEFGFLPGQDLILKETSEGVLVTKKSHDIVAMCEAMAKRHGNKPLGNLKHAIYEQYEERWQRAQKRT